LGSTRKVELNLGETIKKTKFPPPSTKIASNSNDVCTMSVSNAGDVMMMSSSQNKELFNINSILPKKDPPKGKTTAIIAVMRGKSKDPLKTKYKYWQNKLFL
jgi:hypothetical protein